MPSPMLARPDAPAMSPHPDDIAFISLETVSENPASPAMSEPIPEVSVEKSGTIPTKDSTHLRVSADPGNIHIFTDESAQVSYRVRIQADAREPGAEELVRAFAITARQIRRGIVLNGMLPWRAFRGSFVVSYEIHIPRRFNIAVHTAGGNIEVQDIDGRVELFTDGGNITAGRVDAAHSSSPSQAPESQGHEGQIAAKLVTMGGHITIGDVAGTLRATTSGGHITAGNISGDAVLHTGGGQIRTGLISGVGTLDTGGGNIMAWLGDGSGQGAIVTQKDGKSVRPARAASQFLSSEGDVVVFLPRELAASIDAVVDQGAGHRIVADPSLPQKISCQDSGPGAGPGLGTIRCVGDVNGGGDVLHLRAVSGNIVLKVGDPTRELSAASSAHWMESAASPAAVEPPDWLSNPNDPGDYDNAAGFFAEVRRRILESWWGAVPVDADEMQKHLERSVAPVYPDVARKAGVEGDVVLRIYVSGEGRVTALKVLDGPPILARAAVEAVQQWQYQTLVINGRPANVVTTLIVAFRLH